jgi:hypothetical protein
MHRDDEEARILMRAFDRRFPDLPNIPGLRNTLRYAFNEGAKAAATNFEVVTAALYFASPSQGEQK